MNDRDRTAPKLAKRYQPLTPREAKRADSLVSEIHDAIYAYDGQPSAAGRADDRRVWELYRGQINTLIWKLHDVLRSAG